MAMLDGEHCTSRPQHMAAVPQLVVVRLRMLCAWVPSAVQLKYWAIT